MAGVGRLFLAVVPNDEARHALAARLDQAFSDDPVPGRRVPPDSWHFTLRFLGDPGELGLDRVLHALEAASLGGTFRIGLSGLGAFPRPGKAEVLWAGVDAGERELIELRDRVEDAVEVAGLEREDRPFVPHLTLSRIRPATDVWRWLEADPDLRVRWTVPAVVLMRSHRRHSGMEYEPLETFDLDNP